MDDQRVSGIRVNVLNAFLVVMAVAIVLISLYDANKTNQAFEGLENASNKYTVCENAANEMQMASEYLTNCARLFVVTKDVTHLALYVNESENVSRRDQAIQTLDENLSGMEAHRYLERALELSKELEQRELYAMKLVCVANGYDQAESIAVLRNVELTPEHLALSPDEQMDLAVDMMFDETYQNYDSQIESNVSLSKTELLLSIEKTEDAVSEQLRGLLLRQRVIAWISLLVILCVVGLLIALVFKPMRTWMQRMENKESLPIEGVYEMRQFAQTYNEMYEENLKSHARLRRKAEHDSLTGLFNRGAFEELLRVGSESAMALLIIDVDHFKEINDTYGHDGGDRALRKVAMLLSTTFRTTDYACRIGGDEFAVIMGGMTPDLKSVVRTKIASVAASAADDSDGLPSVTLSVGVTFTNGTVDSEVVYKEADKALYSVKEHGRNGIAFFDELDQVD